MRKRKRSQQSESARKGKLVEQIAASMHSVPGVRVEQNVRLPGRGTSRRKREVDILLTAAVAGYPVRVAIECKNERERVDAPRIDAFVGKLDDIGIPQQCGIYIARGGYTSGASERAREAGIRTLILTGLTDDGLTEVVAEAFQSVIYLLLKITHIRVTNEIDSTDNPHEMLMFFDESREYRGCLPDLVWRDWLEGKIPTTLDEHHHGLTIPQSWKQVVDGKTHPVPAASVTVRVFGLVVCLSGQATQHHLVDASSGTIEKSDTRMSFDAAGRTLEVTTVSTETELREHLNRRAGIRLTLGRFRLPRIRYGDIYWPVSERVAGRLAELAHQPSRLTPDSIKAELAGIEGTDLGAIWDPPAASYVAILQESARRWWDH